MFTNCKTALQDTDKEIQIVKKPNSALINDTNLLQNLVSAGGTVYLDDIYHITKPITIIRDVEIIGNANAEGGNSKILMNNSKYNQIFVTQSEAKCELKYIETQSKTLLQIDSDSEKIIINNCKVSAASNSERPTIAIKHSGNRNSKSHHIKFLKISNNIFENTTVAFLDKITTDSLNFESNIVNNGVNYILRAESHLNEKQGYISFQGNTINGLKGFNNKNDENVARVFQASATDSIIYKNNTIKDVEATSSANYIYWHSGHLLFENNTCANITSTTAAIHDKGIDKKYSTTIRDNIFDQSELSDQSSLNNKSKILNPKLGIININRAHNVQIEKNNFIGIETYALRISHPFNNTGNHAQLPSNISFESNTITNINNSTVILVSQAVSEFHIKKNVVRGVIKNDKSNKLSFVELRVTSNHKLSGIKNIVVDSNRIDNSNNNYTIVFINDGNYIHESLNNRKIDNVLVKNNNVQNASSSIKLFKSTEVSNLIIENNTIQNKSQSYKKVKS